MDQNKAGVNLSKKTMALLFLYFALVYVSLPLNYYKLLQASLFVFFILSPCQTYLQQLNCIALEETR
jgi:hypothetical protein